jgi:hypothetical protein
VDVFVAGGHIVIGVVSHSVQFKLKRQCRLDVPINGILERANHV